MYFPHNLDIAGLVLGLKSSMLDTVFLPFPSSLNP